MVDKHATRIFQSRTCLGPRMGWNVYVPRKLRSQTSDNMDRCKAEMGRVREKRRVEERRSEKRKSQKKEDADARKGRKVAKHCVFPMNCGSGGSKSRLAKAAGAEPAGQMRDEKMHAVVARSTFRIQNVQNAPFSGHTRLEVEMSKMCTPLWREAHFEVKMYKTPCSDHFWKLRCRKSARRCGAKHISKSKCTKHHHVTYGPLLEVQMSFRVAGARDCAPSQKWAKREGFVACPKTMAGVGHLKRICKDAFSVAGAVQETSSSELLGGPGADFLRGVAFWSIRSSRFAKMILRDRCSTSYDLASLFRGRRSSFDRWTGKIAKRIGTRPSALHSTFHFWRIVSQNCFVFDVVKFEKWGSLAELLRFGCCPVQKMKKSRRIASFLMLSTSQKWGSLAELLRFCCWSDSCVFWCCQLWKMKKSRRIDRFSSLQIEIDRQTDRQIDR